MRTLEEAIASYPRTIRSGTPVMQPGALILCCRKCARQDHKHCEGTPREGTCYCRQCWTRHILDWYRQTRDTNDPGTVRALRDALYALQFQTMTQKQRKLATNPGTARCSACGAAVPVRRRPPPGQAVYCRDTSRCRVRAFRRRKLAEAVRQQVPATETPAQIPQIPPGTASESSPAALWLALHR